MNKKWILSILAIITLLALSACGGNNDDSASKDKDSTGIKKEESKELNLYTGRHYDTDQQLYDRFTKKTGIKVNVIAAKDDELIARLEREGKASEADVFVTADAGRLARAKDKGLLQSFKSKTLEQNVPDKYRDDDGAWYGLTKRARVIAYDKERVKPEDIKEYDVLATDKFKGKVLIRSSDNIYNQSLVASFIALNGKDEAKKWAEGIVANMARAPKGGDRDQAVAVAAGEGDVAVMNSYYFGQMLNSEEEEEKKAAEKLAIVFPNQDTTGTHVNISGAGIAAGSKNKENAIKFIEFLSEPEQQEQFSATNFEYPVNKDAKTSDLLKSWGDFKEQDIDLTQLGENNEEAIKIMNEVGWK
ncbi:Fe(3+) ABC transporter substrate-binding protein [Aciduricibacillus chroicocephali]|uniref:Fe(3+) ABC transporter substrate-binding protein n=1 Tax=Aciduricibacillus chroicocephali TaxID=3054939 RepID=A0ABY9KTE2_9BACI|nr:Fe(3+) ABC transporter substrate-binding protein [Bacillaceae bacterium 44XB]